MKPKWFTKKIGMICLLAGIVVVAAVVLFVFLGGQQSTRTVPSGTIQSTPSAQHSEKQTAMASASSAKPTPTQLPPFRLSVWVTYWDWENGMKDLNAVSAMPDSVEAFAASFDASDKLFFPKGMSDMAAKLKDMQSANPGLPVYLSIVNDSVDATGKWLDKDSALMDWLLRSDETRSSLVAEVLDIADTGNYSGVEIDFEKISDQTWPGFCDFCAKLNAALQEKNKKMRVVLEPSAPLTLASLPVGPEYVVMAYNLYGDGTEPGPKADEAFIRKLATKMKAIQGSKSIAFATGGYDWDSNNSAVEVTEAEAYDLSRNSQDLQRDSGSGDMYFTYQKDGSTHTVWYADQQTLKGWFDVSRSLGIGDIAVWKMGGDMPETLQMLGQLKESK